MIKNSLFIVGICMSLAALSCVSPFYGTARIEKGLHMDAGLAGASYIAIGDPPSYCVGGRADFEARYGLSEYLGLTGHAGLGYGKVSGNEPGSPSGAPPWTGTLSIGVQTAYPLKYITPAARLEITYLTLPTICPTLLLGIGRNEFLTLGGRAYLVEFWLPYIVDVFLGIHPVKCISIFGGVGIGGFRNPELPIMTLGVAYKIK